jgi:hypothetical protein
MKKKYLFYREGVILRRVAHNIKEEELEFISFIDIIKREKGKEESK